MRSKRRITVVAMAALAAACGRAPAPPAEAPAASARRVTTAPVERESGAGEVAVPASVQARQKAALASRIAASVVALPYAEGQRVAAGAVLVRLDDAALRAALAAAEAAERAASADLLRAESLLAKGAATPRERDEAESRAAAARSATLAVRDSLSYAVLTAPFAGVVASRPARVGDVAAPGATLIELDGDGGLEIRATVEAALVTTLRPGAALRARIDGVAEPVAARVRTIAPAADAATHRFEVRADVADVPGLRAGVFARLLVPAADAQPRLVVPTRALVERGGLVGVLVVAEGKARVRWIAAGEARGDSTEIRAGLEAGERVVLEPGGLADGTPVTEAR